MDQGLRSAEGALIQTSNSQQLHSLLAVMYLAQWFHAGFTVQKHAH